MHLGQVQTGKDAGEEAVALKGYLEEKVAEKALISTQGRGKERL